jgi:hypothetical protein
MAADKSGPASNENAHGSNRPGVQSKEDPKNRD